MVCEHCGNLLREGATVCDQCGAEIAASPRSEGVAARRQGKADRPRTEWVGSAMRQEEAPLLPDAVLSSRRRPRSEGAGRPDMRRGTPPQPTTGRHISRGKREKKRPVRRVMINWALVWTIALALVFLAVIGGYVFLKRTDAGQLILARMGREANAQALWIYGQELLDQGYVDKSIETFEAAYEKDPDREDIYERMQQLADAYEAAGRTAEAEKVYTKMYSEVDEKNPFAYRAVMRLLQNQNRHLELAAFLKLAYEKTGDNFFRRQREDLLPSTPTTDIEAGSLLRERDVTLLSKEDYDIYYLFGEDGVLPEDGILYESPIHLGEGTHILRAVAVSSDLISDELKVQYTINLPVPTAPYSSLAPNEYDRRQRIWLRYLESDEEKASEDARQKDITIYYTIDGQTPTSNSPIFTGEPFYLPGVKVTLKAVAVNGYGKVSNIMERSYKINIPFRNFYRDTDLPAEITVMKTTRDAFIKKYGAPLGEAEIEDSSVTGNCIRLNYSWGEARFCMTETGYVLYFLDTTSPSIAGPRKTKVGMAETEITELFRDMGQDYDQNGDRSLYFDKNEGYGKLYHLDAVNDRIDYVYYRVDQGTTTVSFYLENHKAVRMSVRCAY